MKTHSVSFEGTQTMTDHTGEKAKVRLKRGKHHGAFALWLLSAVLHVLPGCGLIPPRLPHEVYEEGWRIVGINKANNAEVIEVLDFPQRKVARLVSPEDWGGVCRVLGYNDSAGILITMFSRPHGEKFFWDVRLYDMRRETGKWIGSARWGEVGGLAWSEDGRKFAFVAGEEQQTARGPRFSQGCVYVYEVESEQLRQVANAAMIANRSQISSPVWSEDGRFLYYVSKDRNIVCLELATFLRETLPIHAYAIITVKGRDIVYINDHIPYWEEGCGAQVIRCNVQARDRRKMHPIVLYTGGDVMSVFVSPSRRFVLMEDRRSYWYQRNILIDTESRDLYADIEYYTTDKLFNMYATVK